jgi:TolB protein
MIALATTAALGWFAACSDNPADPCNATSCAPPPQGVIVSNPVPTAALGASTGAVIGLAPGAASEEVYVSLAPGTAPTGTRAIVRRVGDTASVAAAVAAGGFDPVPIVALAGDSIEVVVTDAAGAVVYHDRAAVAAARPPVIVRTEPPVGKRDVPLNATLVIVFSEPVNSHTVNSASVQLFRGSTPIAGTVSLLQGSATAAVFTPAAPLAANTDYQLIVTRAVQDLGGQALEAGVTVEFTTGTTPLSPVASVSVQPLPDTVPGGFPKGVQYQFTATARDAQGIVVTGHPVTWAGDNPAVATVSVTGLVTALAAGEATIRAEVDGKIGQVTVRVLADPIRVSVSPSSGYVVVNGTRLFTATVDNDTANSGVTWSLTGCNGDAAACGSLTNTTNTTATYTAPATVPSGSLGVTATSVTDPTKSFTATLAITATAVSGQIAFVSDRDGNSEIYVMNADGSGLRNLTNNPASDNDLACSPDGTRIAFVSDRDGNPEVYVMNADGSGVTRLTDNPGGDYAPAWSPDGTRIAFVSDREGNGGIYVMNADGSGVTRLTDNPGGDYAPAWSPDGMRIAFVSGRDGNVEIYVMNPDGSGQVNLSNNPGPDEAPAWSPDGRRIAFQRSREIYVMNADGSGVTRLNTIGGLHGAFSYPTWSPDGTGIAYVFVGAVCDFRGCYSAHSFIRVMNADGSGITQLTYTGKDYLPAWSPDGTRVAFESFGDGDYEIYVMDANGSRVVRLTNDPASDRGPAWLR